VAAGLHLSPVPSADVVTTTTHKTLRGPRGGLILCKEALAKAIDKAIFPGTQGGPLMHIIAAKAVSFKEALSPAFKDYQKQIIQNASALADALLKEGFDLVSGGTDNHLMLVDLRPFGVSARIWRHRSTRSISPSIKTPSPTTPQPLRHHGIRVGTPAATTRGFKEADMAEICEAH
jgi:glycine hydroxymethyltransferase